MRRFILLLMIVVFLILPFRVFGFQLLEYKIDAKKGKPYSFVLSNAYDYPIYIKVSLDKETIREIPPNSEDCSQNIKVFPKLIKLEPKEQQTIKVLAKSSGYCRMFLLVDKEQNDHIEIADGVNLSIRYQIGIPVKVE